MGSLRFFNLQTVMEKYGCRYLFETGTGRGEGIHYAAFFHFEKIWSVEIHPEIAAGARERFRHDDRVEILNETSEQALARILPTVDPARPILFWLDAHFPGADFGYAGYGDERDADRRLPLERELDLIARLRRPCRDVIIVDDLRIYEDGPFAEGPMPEHAQTLPPERRNIDFVTKGPWPATHEVRRFYEGTGYLAIAPLEGAPR